MPVQDPVGDTCSYLTRYTALKQELAKSFSGDIALRGDKVFAHSVALFNDAAVLGAWMVVLPKSAADIATAVKFCHAHKLSPSVKSGGYATAGWAISGDVVIDTARMDDIQLTLPKPALALSNAGTSGNTAGSSAADDLPLEMSTNHDSVTVHTDSTQFVEEAAQHQLGDKRGASPSSSNSHHHQRRAHSSRRFSSNEADSDHAANGSESSDGSDTSDKAGRQAPMMLHRPHSIRSHRLEHTSSSSGSYNSGGTSSPNRASSSTSVSKGSGSMSPSKAASPVESRSPANGMHDSSMASSSSASGSAASTLGDLQDAWPMRVWAANNAEASSSSTLPRYVSAVTPPAQGAGTLPPGLYKNRFALASFGPGAGLRALDAFTDRAGRAAKSDGVPYHVPVSAYPVGSTSTTIGGFGYLTRAYGLSLDNIVEMEMVLADGRIVTLNDEAEEQDLWWAARGAAPCYGIVSRLTLKAYPVPSVYSGNLIYPMNPATAGSLIRHWRDCLKSGVPTSMYSNLILTAGPSKTSHVIVIQICFLGSKQEGESLVQLISSWTGERMLLKDVEERSFLSQQDGVAKVLKGGFGRRWMVRGDLISDLTDSLISESVRRFQGLGNRAVWLFELMGGAIEDSDAPRDRTCIGDAARGAKFVVGSLQQWAGEDDDDTCVRSVETWMQEVVSKVSIGGPYPCFLGRDEGPTRVAGAFGADNYERMRQIKQRYDPDNLFRHTFGQGLSDVA